MTEKVTYPQSTNIHCATMTSSCHIICFCVATFFAKTAAGQSNDTSNVEVDLSRSEHAEMDSGGAINMQQEGYQGSESSRRRLAEGTFISDQGKTVLTISNLSVSARHYWKIRAKRTMKMSSLLKEIDFNRS